MLDMSMNSMQKLYLPEKLPSTQNVRHILNDEDVPPISFSDTVFIILKETGYQLFTLKMDDMKGA